VLIQHGNNFAFTLDSLLTATLSTLVICASASYVAFTWVAPKGEWYRKQNCDPLRLSSVFETTGNERWIMLNFLILDH